MKPVILITSYYVSKEEANRKRAVPDVKQDAGGFTWDYIEAVELAGGVPLVAPNISEEDSIEAMAGLVDGILFTGGVDVHPGYYNEEIIADNLTICDRRDKFEMRLAKKVLPMDMPLLGICRGMQLLNIAAGGSVYQDIGLQYKTGISHSNPKSRKDDIIHSVRLVENTRLYNIYGTELKEVNSFHHQSVKDLAPVFKASAHAEDGLVEAFEGEGNRFIIGVQWHPEMLVGKYPKELEIFKRFIDIAKEHKAHKEQM